MIIGIGVGTGSEHCLSSHDGEGDDADGVALLACGRHRTASLRILITAAEVVQIRSALLA